MIIREHTKLWRKPEVYLIVLVGLLVNIFLLGRSEYGRKGWIEASVYWYNYCYDKIEDMQTEEAKEYVNQVLEQGYEQVEGEKHPLEYEQQIAYEHVKREIGNAGSYDAYLEEREKEASLKSDFAIFRSGEDSYEDASAEKTIHALRRLAGRELSAEPSRGIKMVMEYMPTDLLGILVLLFGCAVSFMKEKEREEYVFLRTCVRGRESLILAKLLSACLFAAEVVLLLYGANILLANHIYGLGDLHRYLQAVSGYIASGFDGSAGKALLVFLGCKILCYALIVSIIFLLMVVNRRASGMYLWMSAWMGISGVLYWKIGENSSSSVLKNINIVAYLMGGRMLQTYRNINLFGTPVSYIMVFLITVVCALVLCGLLVVILYSGQKIPEREGMGGIMRRKADEIMSRLGGGKGIGRQDCIGLWIQEGKKIFIKQKVLILLLVFGAVIWYSYEPVHSIYRDEQDVWYKQYIDELSGSYSTEKDKIIAGWEEKQRTLEQKQERELNEVKTEIARTVILQKYEKELKKSPALERLREHTDYLKKIKGGFFYPQGYELLTGEEHAGYADDMHALMGVLMLILCLAGIYGIEYESGMRGLIYGTVNGRRKLQIVKACYGILIVTCIYGMVYGPWFYQIFSAYGQDGIFEAVISMEHIAKRFSGFSVLEYLIFIQVLRYIGFLFIMMVVYMLSVKTKSYVMTIAVSVGVFVVPLLIHMCDIETARWILLNPLLLGNI